MLSRAIRALVAILAGNGVNMITTIVLVPLYLTHWSARMYGEWLALFSVVGYLSMMEFGMTAAATNRLTQLYARGELESYAAAQHTATALHLGMAVIGTALLTGIVALVPIVEWLNLAELSSAESKAVIWFGGMQLLWALPLGMIIAVPRTVGNQAKSQWLINGQRVMMLGATYAVLSYGGGPVMVASAQLAVLFVAFVMSWLAVWATTPQFLPGIRGAQVSVAQGLLGTSLFFFLITVSAAVTQEGPLLLLASTMGGVAVALFATTRTLAAMVRRVVGALYSALWPEVTRLEALTEYPKMAQLHRMLVAGSSALCVALGATLWFDGAEIISVWTRRALVPDVVLLRVMVVYLVLQAPWVASSVFTAAANRNLTLAKCHVSNAIVGMAVATVLVPRLGIVGLPLSLIVSELVTCYHFVLKDTCILIKEPYARFAIRTWGTVITAMLASLAMLGIIDSIWTSASMWRWFIDGSVAFLIASAISYVLGLTKADRWNLLTWNRPAWPSPINDVGRSARKRLALLMRAVSQRV